MFLLVSLNKSKVLTSNSIVFFRFHSDTGDATAVYHNLVEQCSKSTAALSASETKQDPLTFPLDDTQKPTNLIFLNAWARILDLDLVLIQAEY
jgi:hypothetical protein